MNMTARLFLLIGALTATLAVISGAYGAHVFGAAERKALFDTALQYHMFHALGLLAVGAVAALRRGSPLPAWAGGLMFTGLVLFCGPLYLHAVTGYRGLAFLAPFGGVAFIASWMVLAVAVWRS